MGLCGCAAGGSCLLGLVAMLVLILVVVEFWWFGYAGLCDG